MATERHRRRRRLIGARRPIRLVLAVSAAPLALAVSTTTHASTAWWQPLAYAGVRVSAVSVVTGKLIVDTPRGRFSSTDGGASFTPTSDALTPPLPVLSGSTSWDIRGGTVLTATKTAGTGVALEHPDPGAPYLGAGAHLLAAPAATPGVVIAVGSDNHVWRRSPDRSWSTAFIPLPAGGLSGTPQVTSVAAFTQPLSAAVYIGVDGYGVLLSENGGDDWIRADPGLPENVLGLATDAAAKALYAATDQGLYVHHLQSFPAAPVYVDSALYLRWLGIGLIAVIATVAALLAMRRLLPRAAT